MRATLLFDFLRLRTSKQPGSFRKILRARDQLFMGAFLAAVLLPFFTTLWVWGRDAEQQGEFRAAVFDRDSRWMNSPLRPLVVAFRATTSFVKEYDEFCALRPEFIRWNGLARVKYLHSPTSSELILGKNNWLFLNDETSFKNYQQYHARLPDGLSNMLMKDGGSLDSYRHLHPLTPTELSRLREYFEKQTRLLNQRGIKFLIVIAPNKESVYPEYMPDALAPAPGQTHLDQFMEAMKNSPVPILDLRPALRKAKSEFGQVYFRDDTHWNDWGAYAAYAATVRQLKKWYPALHMMKPEELQAQKTVRKKTDLTNKAGIGNDVAEITVALTLKAPRESPQISYMADVDPFYEEQAVLRSRSGEIGRVLVFGDSFSLSSYRPFLSQHFRYSLWNKVTSDPNVNEKWVRQVKPDLVILERVERYFFMIPGSNYNTKDALSDATQ